MALLSESSCTADRRVALQRHDGRESGGISSTVKEPSTKPTLPPGLRCDLSLARMLVLPYLLNTLRRKWANTYGTRLVQGSWWRVVRIKPVCRLSDLPPAGFVQTCIHAGFRQNMPSYRAVEAIRIYYVEVGTRSKHCVVYKFRYFAATFVFHQVGTYASINYEVHLCKCKEVEFEHISVHIL